MESAFQLHLLWNLNPSFRFHSRCDRQRIVNLCFADDLFIFTRGDISSTTHAMEVINQFKEVSGLKPSIPKSKVFFCNVPDRIKRHILNIMPFEEGKLPVKYLGVPLISSRLNYKECKILIDNTEKRIHSWKNNCLSFAGRIQLIKSVLSALYVYWSAVFGLPATLIKDLEKSLKRFLWNGGKHKVAWKVICKPKEEGGLGIKRIKEANISILSFNLWSILQKRKSLWVQWICSYRLKGKNVWNISTPTSCTWSWRKILQLRHTIWPYIWTQIGNGKSASFWYDKWDILCPLIQHTTPRAIHYGGFSLQDVVEDNIQNGSWGWSGDWLDRFPVFRSLQPVSLTINNRDTVVWRRNNMQIVEFSTKEVWNSIRIPYPEVTWVDMVWFSQCIPKHAFLLWIIMHSRLQTQDKMMEWKLNGYPSFNLYSCFLCSTVPDSHAHLFFECAFSLQVWKTVKAMVNRQDLPDNWNMLVTSVCANANSKLPSNITTKLLIGASTYMLWKERNDRLHTNSKKPPRVVAVEIVNTVRLKLMTLTFKKSMNANSLIQDWKLPRGLVDNDDDNG